MRSGADANDAAGVEFGYYTKNCINVPADYVYIFSMVYTGGSLLSAIQLAFRPNNTVSRWARSKTSSGWSEWITI